jgi:uncharacterized protein YggE
MAAIGHEGDPMLDDTAHHAAGHRQPPHIAVEGNGRRDVIPDRAQVRFEVTAIEGSRQKAHDAVARRLAALSAVLERARIEARRRQTSAVYVTEIRERDRNQNLRKITGYRATASTSVRFATGQPIGEVVADAVREADASVSGPQWYVSRGNPANLEVYRLAAEDARSKAEAIAAGLGLRVGDVLAADTGGGGGYVVPMMRAAAMPLGGPADEPDFQIDPGEVTVSVSLRVIFAITSARADG